MTRSPIRGLLFIGGTSKSDRPELELGAVIGLDHQHAEGQLPGSPNRFTPAGGSSLVSCSKALAAKLQVDGLIGTREQTLPASRRCPCNRV